MRTTATVGVIYDGTTHYIEVPRRTAGGDRQALTNGVTGDTITGATVTVTLLSSAGAEVSGETWPLSLIEDSGFPGRYVGILTSDISVSAGDTVTAVVVVVSADNLTRTWRLPLRVIDGGF